MLCSIVLMDDKKNSKFQVLRVSVSEEDLCKKDASVEVFKAK